MRSSRWFFAAPSNRAILVHRCVSESVPNPKSKISIRRNHIFREIFGVTFGSRMTHNPIWRTQSEINDVITYHIHGNSTNKQERGRKTTKSEQHTTDRVRKESPRERPRMRPSNHHRLLSDSVRACNTPFCLHRFYSISIYFLSNCIDFVFHKTMRLLERLAHLTHHHDHEEDEHDHDHHHHGPQTEDCGANKRLLVGKESSSSRETDFQSRSGVPRRHSGLFKFRRSTTEESITEGVRQVRFNLDDIPRYDSVFDTYFRQDDVDEEEALRLWESQWYSPQELKDLKMDCARDVAAFLRTNNTQLAQTLATCQSIAYEDSLVETRHQLASQLSPVVGIAHLCCKSFGAALRERRQTILKDVQQAQQRGRRSGNHPHHHHHHHSSVDTDLCQAFLVCRASEHISQPCGRLAGWLAQAIVLDLEEEHGDSL